MQTSPFSTHMTSFPGEAPEFNGSPCVERRRLEGCGEVRDGKDTLILLQRWWTSREVKCMAPSLSSVHNKYYIDVYLDCIRNL